MDKQDEDTSQEQEVAKPTGLEILSPSASILSEMGALYLQVTNHDAVADRLIRVETAAAETAEIHISTEEDGVVRMRHQAEGLEIAPGATLELTQGGSHIMLMGATFPATDPVVATLYFERAGAIEISAPLASMGDMGAAAHAGHEDPASHGDSSGHEEGDGHDEAAGHDEKPGHGEHAGH
jgi:copper(I)-binding protein